MLTGNFFQVFVFATVKVASITVIIYFFDIILQVKGSNPLQTCIFSGFFFPTAKVASISAMTFFFHINADFVVLSLWQSGYEQYRHVQSTNGA